jgi:hypothetical protein
VNLESLAKVAVPMSLFRRGNLTTRTGHQLTVEDKLEMMEATRLFEWAFISQNGEELFNLLTDDIEISHAFGSASGKGEMASGKLIIPSYGLRHGYLNQVVFIDDEGNPACLSCMNVVQVTNEQEVETSLPAIYGNLLVVDVFRRENDSWKICKRIFDQMKLADYLQIDTEQQRKDAQTSAHRSNN